MTDPKSKRANDAVRSFLQTVVVIDDRAAMRRPDLSVEPGIAAYQSITEDADEDIPDDLVAPDDSEARDAGLDVEALTRAFAERGLVCAVLRPRSSDDAAFRLARESYERSDILVVDWTMFRDGGRKARALIKRVVTTRRGIGLIAVYTQERELSDVLSSIVRSMRRYRSEVVVRGDAIHSGSIVVKPLSKWDVTDGQGVKERDLPAALIAEFAQLFGEGLLRQTALRGVATLRQHSHQLLEVFAPSVDFGYVGNRLVLEDPSDAEDQAVLLVGEEMTATLLGADLRSVVGMEAIREWAEGWTPEAGAWGSVFRGPQPTDPLDSVLKVLELGERIVRNDPVPLKFVNSGVERSAAGLLARNKEAGSDSSARYAALMTTRNRYGPEPPRLTLGTVVKAAKGLWYVCLQPACDSVRLQGVTQFPLLPLAEVSDGAFDLAIESGGAVARLQVPRRFRDIRFKAFRPDPVDRSVLAKKGVATETWTFKDRRGDEFDWVADVREPAALRLVHMFASRWSRVGLDEPEWVRRSRPNSLED